MSDSSNKDNIEAEAQENDALIKDSVETLSQILSPHIVHAKKVAHKKGLLEAFRLIMESEGLAWSETAENYFTHHDYTLNDLFSKFALTHRRIRLEKNFWEEGFGPILAFKKEDGAPVALIYEKGRYFLCDPETGETHELNAKLAEELLDEAWTFYHSLPNGSLGWKRIFKFAFFKTKQDTYKLIFIASLIALLGLLIPIAQEILINDVLPESRLAPLAWMISILCASAVMTTGGNLTKVFIELRISSKFTYTLQTALMQRLLKLPLDFFKRYSAGDLATRVLGIMSFSQYFSSSSFHMLIGIPSAIILVLFIVYLNPFFGTLAAALVLIFLISSFCMILLTLKKSRLVHHFDGKLSAKLFQLLSGIDTLHTTGSEIRAFHNFSLEYAKQQNAKYETHYLNSIFESFCTGFPLFCFFMLYITGAYVILNPNAHFNLGEFIAINAAFGSLIGILELFMENLNTLPQMIPIFEELKPILLASPENNPAEQFDCDDLKGKVEMRGVSFRYSEDDPWIFKDLNFEISPGELVAIAGPSGTGKSTLLRLLLGFEKASSGNIFYDDKNLDGLNIESIRRQMGVVMQNSQVLNGSIFENITTGLDYSVEAVWEAAELVGMADDIRSLPMGLFTYTGDNGSNLSAGQRQLIMLARAIIRKPKILILDEATSNLDNKSQEIVANTLTRLAETRIVVAHRLSTVKKADRIFVLKEGRFVESGNFETLMAQQGEFSRLVGKDIS